MWICIFLLGDHICNKVGIKLFKNIFSIILHLGNSKQKFILEYYLLSHFMKHEFVYYYRNFDFVVIGITTNIT